MGKALRDNQVSGSFRILAENQHAYEPFGKGIPGNPGFGDFSFTQHSKWSIIFSFAQDFGSHTLNYPFRIMTKTTLPTTGLFRNFLLSRPLVAALMLVAPVQGALAAEVTPFNTPSLNPLTQIFALPSPALPETWSPGQTGLALQQEVASIYAVQSRNQEQLILDGEVWRTSLTLDYGISQNWLLSINLPFIQHKAGHLDGLIDDWHDWFSLPDGGRNKRPQNAFLYDYRSGSKVLHSQSSGSQGIGDLQLSLSHLIPLTDKQLFITFATKLPTGEADELTGSGSLDLSLSAMVRDSERLSDYRITLFWGGAVAYLGAADSSLARTQNHWVWSTRFGAGWALIPNFHLKAQLDHHSAVYDSPLRAIGGHALQLTAGISWHVAPDTRLDLAFSEDLATTVTPDITFSAAVRQGF